ncbi:MAG: dynamin family protein [Chloroflexota bacterium]
MLRLLSKEHEQLMRQERDLLEELRVLLTRLEATEEDLDMLKQTLRQMDELFLLVVVGEFNAGKTAFLNAMIGDQLLKEGVTPTTAKIHLLRYGTVQQEMLSEDGLLLVDIPVDWLKDINLVDTPGTNAVIREHEEITEYFVPRSDLILFVTSVDRPYSESERAFLERIRTWGKKVIFIVNKIDMIPNEADRNQVLAHVRENARQLIDGEPILFPISAKLALQAKADLTAGKNRPNPELWDASQFAALEDFVIKSLDDGARMKLKMENPLGVAERMINRYGEILGNRNDILKNDFKTIDTIEDQLHAYEEDMRRDFKYHISHVDNVIYAMADRGDEFFDERVRLTRILELANSEKLRNEFEHDVVGDTSVQVERHVGELIDWMVDKDYKQWQDVMDYLNKRSAEHEDRIIGRVGQNFEFNRQNLIEGVGQNAQRVVDSYDKAKESLKLSQDIRSAIVQTAAVEAGAVGLGTVLVIVLQTTLLDITGVLSAGLLAAVGLLYVMPSRRNAIKRQMRTKLGSLRQQLNDVITLQFETELKNGLQRLRESIEPYTRFVRVERGKLEKLQEELDQSQLQLQKLKTSVAKLKGIE